MASPRIWPGGLNLSGTVFDGGPTALELAAYVSGSIQWLDTISGSNANAGTNPEQPVLTLAQAVTNSAANGLIVIGQGSAETLASSQSIALAGLSIWGCGSGTSRPRYTCSGSTIVMLSATAAGIRFRNLYFPASSGSLSNRIGFTAASGEVKDCYFECGATDTDQALIIGAGANNARVRGCTFATTASRPAIGLGISSAVTDVLVEDCVFDGGTFGWTDYALKVSQAATRMVFENLSFIRRADFGITITGTSYQLLNIEADGTSRVDITA